MWIGTVPTRKKIILPTLVPQLTTQPFSAIYCQVQSFFKGTFMCFGLRHWIIICYEISDFLNGYFQESGLCVIWFLKVLKVEYSIQGQEGQGISELFQNIDPSRAYHLTSGTSQNILHTRNNLFSHFALPGITKKKKFLSRISRKYFFSPLIPQI